MDQATRDAVRLADKVIERHRPLWVEVARELGIDINAVPAPGSFEETLLRMPIEDFFARTPRSTVSIPW